MSVPEMRLLFPIFFMDCLFNGNPPKGFVEQIDVGTYFLEPICSDTAVWIIRIIIVAAFIFMIGLWIYMEHKNKPEDK